MQVIGVMPSSQGEAQRVLQQLTLQQLTRTSCVFSWKTQSLPYPSVKSHLWDLQGALSSSCHEAKRRSWIFPSHELQCASCCRHWWEMALWPLWVSQGPFLALFGAFHQCQKGPAGLSISILADPASPLPGWEVFQLQKLKLGAKVKKSVRVGELKNTILVVI